MDDDQPQVNTHPVSSLDRQINPAFHPTSLLTLRNAYRTPNAMSEDTFQRSSPNDAYYRALANNQVKGEMP